MQGVLDRFGQIEPKVMLTVDGYVYDGKGQDIREKVAKVVAGLPKLKKLVVIPFLEKHPDLKALPSAELFDSWLADFPAGPVPYKQLPFDHPLNIIYSTGTTGVPKCILHCSGGVLLQHLKEHTLHVDVKLGDRLFYFTTMSWMLWN